MSRFQLYETCKSRCLLLKLLTWDDTKEKAKITVLPKKIGLASPRAAVVKKRRHRRSCKGNDGFKFNTLFFSSNHNDQECSKISIRDQECSRSNLFKKPTKSLFMVQAGIANWSVPQKWTRVLYMLTLLIQSIAFLGDDSATTARQLTGKGYEMIWQLFLDTYYFFFSAKDQEVLP